MDCPCKSGKLFDDCCNLVFKQLGIEKPTPREESLLLAWQEQFSVPISNSFFHKAGKYIYQLSIYLDSILDVYLPLSFENEKKDKDEIFFNIKHNILLTLFGSLNCISQGLFLQSGVLQRSLIEDCFVLCDLALNHNQFDKVLNDKYDTNNLIKRLKHYLPQLLIDLYGYFSRNFAHFGPLHPAPLMPRKCYPDDSIIITGLQNLFFSIATYHIILERVHIDMDTKKYFWIVSSNTNILFKEENAVFAWMEQLKKEVLETFPSKKEGFVYSKKGYKFKHRK